jgi:hypothetical protein
MPSTAISGITKKVAKLQATCAARPTHFRPLKLSTRPIASETVSDHAAQPAIGPNRDQASETASSNDGCRPSSAPSAAPASATLKKIPTKVSE